MKRTVGACLLSLLFGAGSASAQSKTGTAIAQFMLIEPSARVAAMGNAGVALPDGIQAAYYNPAALGQMTQSAVQFTHSAWLADISYDYAAAALSLGRKGTLFASVTALGSGDMEVRTVEKPLGTGELFSVSDVAIGVAFARQVTPRFGAGIQVNYINETIWHSSLNILTMSVGTLYQLAENGLTVGASISNFGTRARFGGRDLAIQYDNNPDVHGDNSALPAEQFTEEFPVPILFRLGVSLPRQIGTDNTLRIALDAFHPSDNTESISAGAEWWWKNSLALRTGYQNLYQDDSEFGLTLGAGLRGAFREIGFHFDYAWAGHTRLQDTHRVTFVLML